MSRPISRPGTTPLPRPTASSVNTQTKLLDTVAGRILCIADIRGRISSLNELARESDAKAVIHTGDFGFFGKYTLVEQWHLSDSPVPPLENSSLDRINDRYVALYILWVRVWKPLTVMMFEGRCAI